MRKPNRHHAFEFTVDGIGTFEATRFQMSDTVHLAAALSTRDGQEFVREIASRVLLDSSGEQIEASVVDGFDGPTLQHFSELCLINYHNVTRHKTYEKTQVGDGTKTTPTYGEYLVAREDEELASEYLKRLFAAYVERNDALNGKLASQIMGGATDWARNLRGAMPSVPKWVPPVGRPEDGAAARAARHSAFVSAVGVSPSPLPDIPSEARRVLNRFEERLTAFREGLHEDDETLITMTSGLYGETMIAQTWDTAGAGLISIAGVVVSGARVEVVQHHSQFSMTLTAMPKPIEGRTFGFVQHAGDPRPE